MTQSEEIITHKGESKRALENVFLYNKNIEASYRKNINARNQLEIRLSHADGDQLETFQMIFVIKGNLRLSNSSADTSLAEIDTHQHNLCRLPFKSTRLWVNSDDDMICINLSRAFLDRFLPTEHPLYQWLSATDQSEEPLVLSTTNMQITPEIAAVLQSLISSSKSGFANELLLESKAIELFAMQITQLEQMESAEPISLKKLEVERMHEVREILINQTGDQLSLRTLAHLVGTNEFNLKRDFKAVFGKTVYAYLNEHKMEQAKAMLVEQGITVSEIAKKMGYKHATHFTTAFKKYFGFLPNKIRMGKFSMLILLEDFPAILENLNVLAF